MHPPCKIFAPSILYTISTKKSRPRLKKFFCLNPAPKWSRRSPEAHPERPCKIICRDPCAKCPRRGDGGGGAQGGAALRQSPGAEPPAEPPTLNRHQDTRHQRRNCKHSQAVNWCGYLATYSSNAAMIAVSSSSVALTVYLTAPVLPSRSQARAYTIGSIVMWGHLLFFFIGIPPRGGLGGVKPPWGGFGGDKRISNYNPPVSTKHMFCKTTPNSDLAQKSAFCTICSTFCRTEKTTKRLPRRRLFKNRPVGAHHGGGQTHDPTTEGG